MDDEGKELCRIDREKGWDLTVNSFTLIDMTKAFAIVASYNGKTTELQELQP